MTTRQQDLSFPHLTARQWGLVMLTLILGAGLSFGGFLLARQLEINKLIGTLRDECAREIRSLQREVSVAMQTVRAIGALYDSSKEVTRDEFNMFTKGLLASHPGLQALEWTPRVSHSQRKEYVRSAQRAGFPNFQISERNAQGRLQKSGRRSEYFPVYFVEPLKSNESALGFDMASDPARLKALIRARDTGRIVASGRIKLVQAHGEQSGFLILQPVYRQGVPLDSVEDRRRHLMGFAVGVFRICDLVKASLLTASSSGINVSIYNVGFGQKPRFFHSHLPRALNGLPTEAKTEVPYESQHLLTGTINVADRQWKVVYSATPLLIGKRGTALPWTVLGGGLLATLLLTMNVFGLVRKRVSLEWTNQQLEKDIAARRQAEAELAKREETLRGIFNTAQSGIILVDASGAIIFANERMAEMFGYQLNELIGSAYLDHTHSSQSDESRRKMISLMRGDIDHISLERLYRRKDGSTFWGFLTSRQLHHPDGSFWALVSVIQDITERKQAEEENAKLEAQLRQAQKLEALGTLAGGIAHDFNNVLAAIMGYSELALDNTPPEVENRRYLVQILVATTRAQKLIKQILTFSRRAELDMKLVDLNYHVTRTVELIKQTIPRMVNIELHLAEDLWTINGDPGQLEQIVMNLATNASDAMPGGGRLVIETENISLDAQYSREHLEADPGSYVLLQVSDTGQGITKEVMSQIFDPFFTTKGMGKGTGLGLATVYGIVKAHGAFIRCYSEPGEGTIFKIYFPALERHGVPLATQELLASAPPGGSENILVVDDEEALRELCRIMLSREGYTVVTASSGEEALEVLQQKKDEINLVILDMSMPGMGGLKCFQEISKAYPQVKVLVASGYSRNGQLKDILASGVARYIAKPFERTQLLRIIREMLDRGKD